MIIDSLKVFKSLLICLLRMRTRYSISSMVCLPLRYGRRRKKSLVVVASLFSTMVAMYSFSRRDARAGSTIRLSEYAEPRGVCACVARECVEIREWFPNRCVCVGDVGEIDVEESGDGRCVWPYCDSWTLLSKFESTASESRSEESDSSDSVVTPDDDVEHEEDNTPSDRDLFLPSLPWLSLGGGSSGLSLADEIRRFFRSLLPPLSRHSKSNSDASSFAPQSCCSTSSSIAITSSTSSSLSSPSSSSSSISTSASAPKPLTLILALEGDLDLGMPLRPPHPAELVVLLARRGTLPPSALDDTFEPPPPIDRSLTCEGMIRPTTFGVDGRLC